MRAARALAILALAAGPAGADEIPVAAADRAGLTVTIYNDGLALVGDRREVTLAQGPNRLAFLDVSAALQPETARLRVADAVVIEQGLAFDPLTRTRLLQEAVGKTVRVVRTHPETGAETTDEATVLSVADGVVLRIGDRIETDPPGRIVFAEVPAGCARGRPGERSRPRPDGTGRARRYLTKGLSAASRGRARRRGGWPRRLGDLATPAASPIATPSCGWSPARCRRRRDRLRQAPMACRRPRPWPNSAVEYHLYLDR
jgi:hypothetical protein